MGNCVEATDSEDKGNMGAARNFKAIGAGSASIDDDHLDALLNQANAALKQKLLLKFECENLPNLDTHSKTDPFCVVYKMN